MGRLTIPDDATDEQIEVKVREIRGEHDRAQVAAGTARQAAQAEGPMDYLMAPLRGAAQVPGRAVEMGKSLYGGAKSLVTGEAFAPPAERPLAPGEGDILADLSSGMGAGEFPINPHDPLAKGLLRAAAPTILGAVGALAGPPGAGLGVMGGEAINQAFERSGAASRGEPIEPASKMLEDLFATGIFGAATEAMPQVAVKAAGAPAKGFQKKMHGAGREAMAALPFEARPSLAQIGTSRGADIAENVAAASLIGGGRVRQGWAKSGEAAEKLVRKVPADLPTGTGLSVLSKEIETAGKGVIVDYRATREVAKRLLAKERPMGSFGPDDKFVKLMEQLIESGDPVTISPGSPGGPGPAGYTAPVGRVPAVAPVKGIRQIDFNTMKDIRSNFSDAARSTVGPAASKGERGAVRHLAALLKKDMQRSAAAGGHRELLASFDEFNRVARQASTRTRFEEMITQATDTTVDVKGAPGVHPIRGKQLYALLYKAKKDLKGTWDPEALDRFDKFSRVLQTAQSKSAEGTGTMLTQMKQAGAVTAIGGAVGGAATGRGTGVLGGAAAALGVPYVMARALTSPRLYRYLTEGFKNVGTPRGNAAINALMQEIQAQPEEGPKKPGKPYKLPWEKE
jgi:hypothetical protein